MDSAVVEGRDGPGGVHGGVEGNPRLAAGVLGGDGEAGGLRPLVDADAEHPEARLAVVEPLGDRLLGPDVQVGQCRQELGPIDEADRGDDRQRPERHGPGRGVVGGAGRPARRPCSASWTRVG